MSIRERLPPQTRRELRKWAGPKDQNWQRLREGTGRPSIVQPGCTEPGRKSLRPSYGRPYVFSNGERQLRPHRREHIYARPRERKSRRPFRVHLITRTRACSSDRVPAQRHRRNDSRLQDFAAIHQPDSHLSGVLVVPQEVHLAVTVVVVGPSRTPARGDIWQVGGARYRGAIHEPDGDLRPVLSFSQRRSDLPSPLKSATCRTDQPEEG